MTITGDWVEGDALTPTNLSTKGGGNFPDRTYNAGWARFGASNVAKETRIQAAITQAAANGVPVVFIPASMLPYDASAVTFNNAVHMVREGGPPYTGWYDVRAYGATLNHVADDTTAVNAALTAALASSTTSGAKTLWFDGLAGITSPIRVTGPGITFLGRDQGWYTERSFSSPAGSGIAGLYGLSGWQGPLVIVEGGDRTFPGITTSLVSGPGNAFDMSVQNTNRISLWPIANSDLNGLSAFTVCFWYRKNGASLRAPLTTISGRLLNSDSSSWPMYVWINLAGKLEMSLTTTGGTATINGGSVIVDADVNYVEANYDGSTARLFLNGTLIASTALTGTISCQPYNTLTIGPDVRRVPDQDRNFNGGGIIDSIEFSNVARNTVNYTPPASKHTADSHTLALFNFDNQVGYWTVGDSKDGDVWAYHTSTSFGAGVEGFTATGFHFESSTKKHIGLHLSVSAGMPTLYRCSFGFLRAGIFGPHGNHFQWQFDRLFFNGDADMIYAIAMGQNSSIGELSNVWLYNSRIPFLLAAAGGVVVRSVHWACSTGEKQIAAIVSTHNEVTGSPIDVVNFNVDTESGLDTTYRGAFLIGAFSGFIGSGIHATGCNVLTRNGAPFIVQDGAVDTAKFTACNFQVLSGADPSAVAQILGTPSNPIVFDRCGNHGAAFIPWSDTTGTAIVRSLGPYFSSSTGGTIIFNASVADEWDLTLTSDVTLSNWTKISYGQPVSGAIKMDSTGSRLFTWPTNSKGTVTLSYGSSAVNTFTGFYDGVNVILTSVRTGL